MKSVVVTHNGMLPTMLHTYKYTREREEERTMKVVGKRKRRFSVKITVSEADSTDSKFYGSVNNSTTIPQSKCISRR